MIPILRDHDPKQAIGEIDAHGAFRIYDTEDVTFEQFSDAFGGGAGWSVREWREQGGKRFIASGQIEAFSVGLGAAPQQTPDVQLSNGALVCHRMIGRKVQQTFVVRNPGGQMTRAEWAEYNRIVSRGRT